MPGRPREAQFLAAGAKVQMIHASHEAESMQMG